MTDYLKLYDAKYFAGGRAVSGYDDYTNCRGVLYTLAAMVNRHTQPKSVFDAGAAYGFLVEWFNQHSVEAWGMEPSEFALSKVPIGMVSHVYPGALPNIPKLIPNVDVVVCTEVLEHVPETDIPASLRNMAEHTKKFLVCLIMLEGPGADGDIGHITLKSKEWWQAQFAATGLLRERADLAAAFDAEPYSQQIYWSGRWFVWERI